MVIDDLHAHVLLNFLDRDFAREAVMGAIEANDLGDQAPDETLARRRWLAEMSFAARRSREPVHALLVTSLVMSDESCCNVGEDQCCPVQ
jgi:hypothetical protein